eukprot:CAMPEP_0173151440 /NCGR_PEP_ID=MMETSP1105-20130129/11579_1 /TAXON_ID=2985 /ORGANISM="Ochromonas sp., Strain BG-1" /LENGTH=190 /DNA_ID=CAMNT_0014066811 /DNA_START=11 /DNA_END=583 /DNA_ORIENTATION=-
MIPSNYHHAVRYASYHYSSHNQVPEVLRMSEELHILSNQVLPKFSLTKEYELIAHYSDWSNAQKSKSKAEKPVTSNPAPSKINPYELPDLSTDGNKTKDISPSITAAPISSGYNSNNYMLPNIDQPPNSSNPQPIANTTLQNNAPNNEYLVMRMMQETGQDRDICYFLLESVNWDFNAAMEIMMQNLQVK